MYRVDANWDDEANVWVAVSDDVPGLVTEADTKEALIAKLRVMIPELLTLNAKQVREQSKTITLTFHTTVELASA